MRKIHPTAIISPGAVIGGGAEIGAYTQIHENVVLEERVKVDSYCELGVKTPLADGSPLCIGANSHIRSHSVFYMSSSFGQGLVTGHGVTVRENTHSGPGFQIGTGSEIQGDCSVGEYVRFQSNIFVGKKTKIGNYVWLFPYVILTNDPTPPSNLLIGCSIGDYASIAAGSIIFPGVVIGKNAVIGAGSCVTKDVPSGDLAMGVPARVIGPASMVKCRDAIENQAYPWTRNFSRGYPLEVIKIWEKD